MIYGVESSIERSISDRLTEIVTEEKDASKRNLIWADHRGTCNCFQECKEYYNNATKENF